MGSITVKLYTILRDKLGTKSISLEAANVQEALARLEERFGSMFRELLYKDGKIRDYYILLLNGRNIDKQKLRQVKLNPGDILHIFPPIAGG